MGFSIMLLIFQGCVLKRKGVRRTGGEQRERFFISLLDFDWEFGGKAR
jgi:GT2 family glycosyltransferase